MKTEKLSLFNTRYEPAKPSQRVYDSSENAKLNSTLKVDSNLATISFRNQDCRIAEWPKGCGTNTLDFSLVTRNGYYYEVCKSASASSLLKFPGLPEDYAAPTQPRINTPIMNKVLDNIHDYQFETISTRLTTNEIKGGRISKLSKPVDQPPTTGKIGPGDYDAESSIAWLRQRPSNLKFSTVPRSFEFCQSCSGQKPRPRLKKRFRTGNSEQNVTVSTNGHTTTPPNNPLHVNSISSSIVRDIKFSTMDRWRHPMYKREKYIKTSGIKLSHDFDKILDKKLMFSMADAAPRGDGLNINSTTSGVNVDADCGGKMTIKTAVKLSPIRYSAAFKSTAEMGMKYDVPASGTGIGPGTFIPPSAVQVRNPDKPSFTTYPRIINFGFVAAPDPPGDIKPPSPIIGGKFNQAGQLAGRNVHLMNVAKKKFSKVYPDFAERLYGSD
jgi:hypothetical protein